MSEQVVKNLVYLAKILICLPDERMMVKPCTASKQINKQCQSSDSNNSAQLKKSDLQTLTVENGVRDSECERGQWISLDWLAKKMVREARFETANNAKSTLKRSCIFKWLAAVALSLDRER